jgi:major membrane immunogen (membrane-anchored lipoprotein)
MVTIEVEDGEIVEAEWNGAHKSAGTSKVTQSESGEYGMVEKGDAIAPWYEQAEKTEQYLLETQDPTKIEYSNDAGNTDAISGVTIHVKEYFTLAQKALQQGPDGYGMWEDGHYHAEAGEFSENGWKATVDLTVVSGYIVAANWNSIPEEGGKKKKQASMEGEYGMVANSNAELHWYEQAARAEQYLLETQDPTDISYTDDGATDAISGVSITVDEFFTLAQEALEGAKR